MVSIVEFDNGRQELKNRQPASDIPLPSSSSISSFPVTENKGTGLSSTAFITPPELEQTLSMLSSHRTVLGYLLLSRTAPISIIRHSGVVFDGEQGKKYAGAVGKIVEAVRSGLEDVSADGSDSVRASMDH